MKRHLQRGILAVLLSLAGCATVDTGVNHSATSANKAQKLDKLQFTLPDSLKWEATPANNGAVTIYSPKGVSPKKTPIKFVYQYVAHQKDPKALAAQIIAPQRNNCVRSTSNQFNTRSQYANQVNYQTLCNQMKGTTNGLISYVDIFSDATGSHVLIGEVKTPASVVPGKLNTPRNEQEQNAVNNTIALINLAQKTMLNVTACQTNGACQ